MLQCTAANYTDYLNSPLANFRKGRKARPMPDLICEPCRNRITAEAIDRRARLEKMAEHGMS